MTQSVCTAAMAWITGTMLGTFATAMAVIAVASVGFLMFTGRVDVRRGAQVVFGCFIIFGASTIANGLLAAVSGHGEEPQIAQNTLPPPPQFPPPIAGQVTNAAPFDPYAGAAIKQQ